MSLKNLQRLLEEADPLAIQKEITKGTDQLPIDPPIPGKIFNSVEEAIDEYVILFNEANPDIKLKIQNLEDDEYQFFMTMRDENFEYRDKYDRFVSSKLFRSFKRSLGELDVEQTQLDFLSSIEHWNIDETQAPKYTFVIKTNLAPMI